MVRIYKVQLPIDTARASKEGTMWPDMAKRPEMLIYQRGGPPRHIKDEALWDRMMAGDNRPGEPQGWLKAYWKAEWDASTRTLTFIEPLALDDKLAQGW